MKREQRIKEITLRAESFERELIAKLLAQPSLVAQVRSIISKDDFHFFGTQYEKIVESVLGEKDVLMEFRQAGYLLSEFMGFDLLKGNIREVSVIVRDIKQTSSAWKMFRILETSLDNIPDDNLYGFAARVQRGILENIKDNVEDSSDVNSVIKDFKDRQVFYKQKFINGNGIIGISTGYKKLDAVIDGIRPEHLWIIGGYSNLGKSSASLNITANLVKEKKRVVFYSLEMSKIDILSRLLGIMTKQSGLTILKDYPHNVESVKEAMQKISDSNMSIHNNKYDMDSIEFSMYDEHMKSPVDLFIIDFIQLITVKGAKSEYETTTSAILQLQQTAKRLKVPIIVLSQISNEGAKSSNEMVMSFKGTGALGSAADLAIEIQIGEESNSDWKMKLFNGEPVKMKWNIRKNRHGKVGFIPMNFTGLTGIFESEEEKADRELDLYKNKK